jgi:RNA-directed DNA polymerase
LTRSSDEHRKPKFSDENTAARAKAVKPSGHAQRVEQSAARAEGRSSAEGELWVQGWERENLMTALKRVEQNGGAPGIDGMTVQELRPYLSVMA